MFRVRATPAELLHLLFDFASTFTSAVLFVFVFAHRTRYRHNVFVCHKKISILYYRFFEFVYSVACYSRRFFFILYIF